MRPPLLALALAAAFAAGCGTKGPLTLPPPVKDPARPALPAQPRADDSKALPADPVR